MYICPVCGCDQLSEKPYDEDKNPSYEICNCCGFEFGYDDLSNEESFNSYRKKWVSKGAEWFNKTKCPDNWSLERQMNNLKKL